MRAARNKKVQKAALQLGLAAGAAAYNKKKYGINPFDGVKQTASLIRGSSSRISTKA